MTIHSNISEATRLSASPVRNPVKKLNTTEENDTATPARAVYTQLLPEKDDEYIVKVARTLKDAKVLIECGFEYVTDMDNYKLFRKRK